MDRARIESEEVGKKGGPTVEEMAEEGNALSVFFAGSAVCTHPTVRQLLETEGMGGSQRTKIATVRFLNLEKSSLQWYGSNAFAYFHSVVPPRLLSPSVGTLQSRLDLETSSLEKSLYSLSSQTGAVPAVFAAAGRVARENAKAQGSVGGDDNDVVEVEGSVGREKGGSTVGRSGEVIFVD